MSQKVKEETKEVYLGGVRLWKNETLTNTPTESEKDTDIGKFWYFLLELVGHGVDSRIEKLVKAKKDLNDDVGTITQNIKQELFSAGQTRQEICY